MAISTRTKDSATRSTSCVASATFSSGCRRISAIRRLTDSSIGIAPILLLAPLQGRDPLLVFLRRSLVDLPVRIPEAANGGFDVFLAVLRLHRLERLLDPLDVPALVLHDPIQRLADQRMQALDSTMPSVLGDHPTLEYLGDRQHLHQVGRDAYRTRVLVLIRLVDLEGSGSELV